MLTVSIDGGELWDERTERFIYTDPKVIKLEHSLISLSKWESKWEKPFLTKEEKTDQEILDYIRCMTITQNVDPITYLCLSRQNINDIIQYMKAPMTATTISRHNNKRPNREEITSELIYYWMVAFRIPFECEKWHLNRLFTLIRVCEIKSQRPKKRSRNEILSDYAAINAARRKQYNTKG